MNHHQEVSIVRRRLAFMRLKNVLHQYTRSRILLLLVAILGCLMLYSITFISSTYNPFAKQLIIPPNNEPEAAEATPMVDFSYEDIVHANTVDLQFDKGDGLLELSPNELQEMVSRTKGYLARDWSLGLGWNNVRYIIETSLNHAQLMNRTLVLPSFILGRACEFHIDVCARYARTVNRNDAVGSSEWRKLPLDRQQAFMIPLQVMVDIPYLRRQNHSIVLVSEFLHLQGLNRSREIISGAWDRQYYHQGDKPSSLFVIPNGSYDPPEIVRVDKLPSLSVNITERDYYPLELAKSCNETLSSIASQKERPILEWSDMKQAIESLTDVSNEIILQSLLEDAGWAILHTWQGAIGMDFTKDVVKTIQRVAPYERLRGFVEDFAKIEDDVVLLEGEIHLGRKPGSLYFTTEKGRDNFATIVLRNLRPSEEVRNLAKRLVRRMHALNQGRHWIAAHMRRGDFVTVGWINESTLQAHFQRILERLETGRQLLERIIGSPPERYDVPFATIPRLSYRKPPLKDDFIYLATDERSSEAVELFRNQKAKVFGDLITIDDRRLFGWSLLFTDVIAVVEQQIIGTGAAYVYAHGMSSVAGGIMNIRAASGWDSRTAKLDY